MVAIKPFKGWYFDTSKAGGIENLVAPPHDVISDEEREGLYSKSEHNAVRLVLPKNGYTEAAEKFNELVSKGIIVEDEKPAYYAYEQEFEQGGQRMKRMGFIALVKADPPGQDVLPHEQTFPEKVKDRAELFATAKMDTSPVFALYHDRNSQVRGTIDRVVPEKPLFEFRDKDGVINRVWPVYESEPITNALKDEKIIIADGHHRYTAASQLAADGGPDFTMMYLVDINDPALKVLPTHRHVRLPGFDLDAFLSDISNLFDVTDVGDVYSLTTALSKSGKHTYGVLTKKRSCIIKLKDPKVIESLIDGNRSREWKNLDVSVLHELVIGKSLGHNGYELDFTKRKKDAADLVSNGNCDVAFLLKECDVGEVIDIVKNREVMPHKSTYFYPKPLAGLIIRKMG